MPIESEVFSILVNAGGLGAITLLVWNNQNWIKSQVERIEGGLQNAHKRIDDILQKGHDK